MSMEKHIIEFLDAVSGNLGDLDCWLECNNEEEVRAAVNGALHEKDEIILAQQVRIEQLKHALSVGWSPYYINGIDARKLADEALAIPDDLSALRVHDAKLLAPYQWQPIETAPKDGEVILVSHIFNDKIYWVEAAKQKYGAWFRPTGHAVRQPTHWMLLPTAIAKGEKR